MHRAIEVIESMLDEMKEAHKNAEFQFEVERIETEVSVLQALIRKLREEGREIDCSLSHVRFDHGYDFARNVNKKICQDIIDKYKSMDTVSKSNIITDLEFSIKIRFPKNAFGSLPKLIKYIDSDDYSEYAGSRMEANVELMNRITKLIKEVLNDI